MKFNDKLFEKLSAEYDCYLEWLLQQEKNDIIKNSHKTTLYNEIVELFEDDDYMIEEKVAEKLISKPDTLKYLAEEFMECDETHTLISEIDNFLKNLKEFF